MTFVNYFTCRTQRVQLKTDTEKEGKENFGVLLSGKGASIIPKKRNARHMDAETNIQSFIDHAEHPEGMMDDMNSDANDFNNLIQEENRDALKYLIAKYKDEMLFMLETGLNLVIYGIGSKINFMKKFTMGLKGSPMLIVNGFHPGLTLKTALKELTGHINHYYIKPATSTLKMQHKFFSMHDNIEYLMKILSITSLGIPKIYIIITSLDGGNLKSLELQRHLSILARCEKIGIIVTVDTLKPAAFWDDAVLDRYNFVFYQIDTYEEFHLEKSLSTPLFSLKNEREELGLSYVLKSFTSYQVEVIRMIAKFQLDNPHEPGIKEKELFENCIEQTILSDLKTLKDLLHEVRDHKLLFEKEDKDGNSYLYLKLKSNILEKIVNNQFNNTD